MTARDTQNTVEAVEKTFRIIELLFNKNGAGVTELSNELGNAKSGIHKHLTTLVNAGYVVKEEGKYRLSLQFLHTGASLQRRQPLYDIAKPEINALAERTDDFVYLVALEGNQPYCIITFEGQNAVRPDISVGEQIPFHRLATGKAILAHLSKEFQDLVLSQELTQQTNQTITDREILESELDQIKQDGIAYQDEENVYGIREIGAVIRSESDTVLGAIGLSGPASMLTEERIGGELRGVLLQTANFIEAKYSLQSNDTYQAGSHLEH